MLNAKKSQYVEADRVGPYLCFYHLIVYAFLFCFVLLMPSPYWSKCSLA